MCDVCVPVFMWGSEDNMVEQILSFSFSMVIQDIRLLPVSLPELLTHRSLRTTLISLTHFVFSQTSIFKMKALFIFSLLSCGFK